MLVFGNKPCLSALRVGLGFSILLQGYGSHGQDSCSICPFSLLLADRAPGRTNTGTNTLLQPCIVKTTLQKQVSEGPGPSFSFKNTPVSLNQEKTTLLRK